MSAGAGFSADSGLPVYKDIANVPAYHRMGVTYADLCEPRWIVSDPEVFFGTNSMLPSAQCSLFSFSSHGRALCVAALILVIFPLFFTLFYCRILGLVFQRLHANRASCGLPYHQTVVRRIVWNASTGKTALNAAPTRFENGLKFFS